MRFKVLELDGSEPDLKQIALKEDWAKGLMHCDMEGFALQWDGSLILCDECAKFAYAPSTRFVVQFIFDPPLQMTHEYRP